MARFNYHLTPLSVLFLSPTPTSDIKKMYKIIVSGVTFTLSEASIRSDSPDTNLLAMSLLGDFAEAKERTLVLDRNPTSFRFVRDHLAGYSVFPFDNQDHEGMSAVKLMQYLREDCEYYGFQRLKEIIDEELQRRTVAQSNQEAAKPKVEVQAVDVPKPPSLETCIQGHIAKVEAWKLRLLCAKEEYDRNPYYLQKQTKEGVEGGLADASYALASILARQQINQWKS